MLSTTGTLTCCPCGFGKALTWLRVMISLEGEGNALGEMRLLWGESRTGEKHPEPFPRALWQCGRIFCRGFISLIAHRSVP